MDCELPYVFGKWIREAMTGGWKEDLESIFLKEKDFAALPEYSMTLPTFHESWLQEGRMWRRDIAVGTRPPNPPFKESEWVIGKWIPSSVPGEVITQWFLWVKEDSFTKFFPCTITMTRYGRITKARQRFWLDYFNREGDKLWADFYVPARGKIEERNPQVFDVTFPAKIMAREDPYCALIEVRIQKVGTKHPRTYLIQDDPHIREIVGEAPEIAEYMKSREQEGLRIIRALRRGRLDEAQFPKSRIERERQRA